MEEYEEDYEGNGVEYEEYRGRPSAPPRNSYPNSRAAYRDEYETEYYRESPGPYSKSSFNIIFVCRRYAVGQKLGNLICDAIRK